MKNKIYAEPQIVTDLSECSFYHTMEIPGHGLIEGRQWDLREQVDDYIGRVNFSGKRVLEIGPANGFLTIEMEKRGAEVICCDLSPEQKWDLVPYQDFDNEKYKKDKEQNLRQLNKAFWLTHTAYKSKAKVVYSSVYEIPGEIGPCNTAILGAVLLHLRDPLYALQKISELITETIIVTDMMPETLMFKKPPLYGRFFLFKKIFKPLLKPEMVFLPDQDRKSPADTWWAISPELICQFLKMIGFPKQKVLYHSPKYQGNPIPFFTIVGERNT